MPEDHEIRREIARMREVANEEFERLRLGGFHKESLEYKNNVLRPIVNHYYKSQNSSTVPEDTLDWWTEKRLEEGATPEELGLRIEPQLQQIENEVLKEATSARRGFLEGTKTVRDSSGTTHEIPSSKYKELKSRGLISAGGNLTPENYRPNEGSEVSTKSEYISGGRLRDTEERRAGMADFLADLNYGEESTRIIVDYKMGTLSSKDEGKLNELMSKHKSDFRKLDKEWD